MKTLQLPKNLARYSDSPRHNGLARKLCLRKKGELLVANYFF